MARFLPRRARLLLLLSALLLPLVVAEAPAEAQTSGVRARRARARRAQAQRQRLRERRQRRAARLRARRQRIRERTAQTRARRRGGPVAIARHDAGGADMDFTAEASMSGETELEAPPPMDMSYVEEAEAEERQRRLDGLDPELYEGVSSQGIADDELASPQEAAEQGMFSPLTARLTFGLLNRGLGFSGYERGALTPYTLPAAGTIALAADYYPGAHVTNDALAHLGFAMSFQNSLGVTSTGPNGTDYPTNMYNWQVGARYRVPLDGAGSQIVAEADIGQQGFSVNRGSLEDPAPVGVPAIDYTQLRLGASGRFAVDDVAFGARAAYLPVLDAGALGATLGGAEVHGFEGAVSFSYQLPMGFAVLAEVDTRVYALSFNPAEDAEVVATSALDHYVGVQLGIEWRMPAGASL